MKTLAHLGFLQHRVIWQLETPLQNYKTTHRRMIQIARFGVGVNESAYLYDTNEKNKICGQVIDLSPYLTAF